MKSLKLFFGDIEFQKVTYLRTYNIFLSNQPFEKHVKCMFERFKRFEKKKELSANDYRLIRI